MSSGRTLRELLTGPRALVVPGVPNALIARVAEETGFPAVFFTGGQKAVDLMAKVLHQVGRKDKDLSAQLAAIKLKKNYGKK